MASYCWPRIENGGSSAVSARARNSTQLDSRSLSNLTCFVVDLVVVVVVIAEILQNTHKHWMDGKGRLRYTRALDGSRAFLYFFNESMLNILTVLCLAAAAATCSIGERVARVRIAYVCVCHSRTRDAEMNGNTREKEKKLKWMRDDII